MRTEDMNPLNADPDPPPVPDIDDGTKTGRTGNEVPPPEEG